MRISAFIDAIQNALLLPVLFMILFCENPAAADDSINSIHIVSPVWEDYTNEDGTTGLYWEVLHAVYDPVNIALNIETVPYKRAQKMVAEKRADAIPGVSPLTDPYCYMSMRCLDFLMVIALYNPEKITEWKGNESLINHQVAWVRGYDFFKLLNVKVNYLELTDLETALKMLQAGRLEIVLDYITDIETAAEKVDLNLKQYSTREVFPDPMYMGFAKTEHGQKFLATYDERIESLYESGRLQKIYLKWGYEFKKNTFAFRYKK